MRSLAEKRVRFLMSHPIFQKSKLWPKRLGAVAVVFGCASAAVLYALGYYDLAFLDREKVFGKQERETTQESAATETRPRETIPPADTEPGADTTGGTVESTPETAGKPQGQTTVRDSVAAVTNPELLSDEAFSIPTSGSLTDKGYRLTADTFDAATMRLGRMRFGYKLPEKFSENTRVVQKAVLTEPADNSEVTVSYVDAVEARPALELYMGAILFDRGDQLFYIDSDGVARFTFDDTQTIPAYTRDLSGNPLFYRLVWNGTGYDRVYYRVEGKAFVPSAYNDDADGRGLYFDYPADYGLPDDGYVKAVEGEEDAAKRYADEVKALEEADHARRDSIAALPENEQRQAAMVYDNELKLAALNHPDYDGRKLAFFKNGVNFTGYRFLTASQFSGGLAAVCANENRRSLYFIDGYGRTVLGTTSHYYMAEYERYVITSYRAPLVTGEESVGSFYFDHGYVRVRKQLIDYYAYQVYHNVRVIMDEDVLVDRAGNEFPIPMGYTLCAYSDGVLMLEKDGKYGFMDYTGDWIAQPIYAAASAFRSGLATLTTPDGRVGMIDHTGRIVLPFCYSYISSASDGLIAAFDGAWRVYKIMEK